MTDFNQNNPWEPEGNTPQPSQDSAPQAGAANPMPQENAQVPQGEAGEPAVGAPTGNSNPYGGQTPHLTWDPNETPNSSYQGDPFRTPEPPHAPEPPQPEPEPQQAPQYGAPQYGAPQYGAPQYGAPQYQPPQYNQPPQQPYYQPQYNVPPAGYNQKSRLAAGLLGILLGSLGIHNFYLGFTSRGVVQLIVSLVGGVFTCGLATVAIGIWGFIEGILILTASPSRMYDGNGVILRD